MWHIINAFQISNTFNDYYSKMKKKKTNQIPYLQDYVKSLSNTNHILYLYPTIDKLEANAIIKKLKLNNFF